jgi:DNA-binding NarL/FixJ family response regulator
MNEITIVVVDDHPLFRRGVIDSLSLEPQFIVIGQSSDGLDGLELIRAIRPNVAVIDVNLPSLNGQQMTRQILAEKLPTKVVLLTAYDDDEQRIHAMRVGASAYCTKDVMPEVLLDIVRNVVSGGMNIGDEKVDSDVIQRWVDAQFNELNNYYTDTIDPFQPLSSREMEVLSFVTRGLSNKEIAALLGISHQTVKNHVTAILRKLGVEDRTQAAIFALQKGWMRLNDKNISLNNSPNC